MAGYLSLKDEKERAAYLKKNGGGVFREGHFKLGGAFVKVTAQTYPNVKWFIEDVITLSPPETTNRRELTDDLWNKLESWL